MKRPQDPRVEPFVLDNERWQRKKKRPPWAARVEMIQEAFPSVVTLNWHDVLKTELDGPPGEADSQPIPVGILLQLLRIIAVVDQNQGKDGNRSELDPVRGRQLWHRATGRGEGQYTQLPFAEAFRRLIDGDALSKVALKTSIPKTRVHRLLHAQERPSVEDMRCIAQGYGKDASYFHEYRAEYVMAAIAHRLDAEPDQTVVLFRQLVRSV